MKTCTKCSGTFPLDHFPNGKGAQGRRAKCRPCHLTERRESYRVGVQNEAWRQRRRRIERISKYGKVRYYNAKVRHGIEREQYDAMLAVQKSRCAICSIDISADPCIDHCHRTSRVRGLLCRRCNGALGSFDDSCDKLRSAITYLERSECY